MMQAMEVMKAEALHRAPDNRVDPYSPKFKPKTKVITGEEARKVADQPRLSGHSEWDAVELAETDPSGDPVDPEFLKGLPMSKG